MVDVQKTFGALLVGGIIAAIFSGIVTAQSFIYFKLYPKDRATIKALVLVVWFLDFWHTIFVSMSIWDHLILHFGDVSRIDFIPWSLALTIAFTAILTFLVHLFFIYRIFRLSSDNPLLAIPLAVLACARLSFACLTTAKMITLRSLGRFVALYTWSFTLGLSLSSLLDVLITGMLCYLLLKNRERHSNMNRILDSLMLYTFENGALTCAVAVASLICWITDNKNLIFMGLHFIISKCYANSLLATLNTRKELHTNPRSGTDFWDRPMTLKFSSISGAVSRAAPLKTVSTFATLRTARELINVNDLKIDENETMTTHVNQTTTYTLSEIKSVDSGIREVDK